MKRVFNSSQPIGRRRRFNGHNDDKDDNNDNDNEYSKL